MPTFEFHCDTCNITFAEVRPMGTKTLPACPECKSAKTRKIIRPPAVVFKGSGFYKTDSSKQSAAPKKTPDAKAETKPEPKKEAPPAAEPPKKS
jgi:putative FmdB family regulatory protein